MHFTNAFELITDSHIYNHFGSDDPDVILDIIRFLCCFLQLQVRFL